MAVSVQNFTQLVENQVAVIQGTAKSLLDFTVGSVLRVFVEAMAGVALFLQAQALQVAALTRAATSTGADLDSYFADFGFTRLAAVSATGYETFSRFTATNAVNLPVGTLTQSFDGSQQFAVAADPTNAAYSATLNAYTIPAGTASLTVLAQAVTAGAAGNIVAGTLAPGLVSTVPGIDQVTNAASFAGGANPESDTAFRARFVSWLGSLSRATRAAVLYAVNAVQQGLTQSLVENQNYATGATQYGYFYDVVDDGSGNPPSSLIAAAAGAIDAVRPIGTTFSVFPPSLTTAAVSMTISTSAGYVHATIAGSVAAAITSYIDSLPLGTSLSYTRLLQVAYDVSPGITNVTGLTINSATADLAASPQQVIRAGAVSAA